MAVSSQLGCQAVNMTLPAGRICCSTPGCGAVAADRWRPLLSIDVLPAAG